MLRAANTVAYDALVGARVKYPGLSSCPKMVCPVRATSTEGLPRKELHSPAAFFDWRIGNLSCPRVVLQCTYAFANRVLIKPEVAAVRQHAESLVEKGFAMVDAAGHEAGRLAMSSAGCQHRM